MIKLFQSTDTLFSSNGDKIIIPLRAIIHKKDNGFFYLDLETDLSYIDDIVKGFIIIAPTHKNLYLNFYKNYYIIYM